MPRAARRAMPRKIMPSNRGTRSRAEAAIELVRLEYERERLTSGIRAANATLDGLEDGLRAVEERIEQLTALITPPAEPNRPVSQPGPTRAYVSTPMRRKP